MEIALAKSGREDSEGIFGDYLKTRDFVDSDHVHGRIRGSRYEAARIVLEASDGNSGQDLNPINLFDCGIGGPCPIPLYVLYRIHEPKPSHGSRSAVSYNDLAKDVIELGFTADQLRNCLSQFIRRDRRLLFSGIDDDASELRRWEETPDRSIYLTWTGARYVRDIVVSPAYIQWAFSSLKEMRARFGENTQVSMMARIGFALDCFEHFIDDELRRMAGVGLRGREALVPQELHARTRRAYGFASLGPVCDVFLRSTAGFMLSMANAMLGRLTRTVPDELPLRYSASPRPPLDLMSLVERWEKAVLTLPRRYAPLFGEGLPEDWENVISWTERDVEKLRKQVRDLENQQRFMRP
jgi:hypothetical protein